MKKISAIIAIILAAAAVFGAVACTKSPEPADKPPVDVNLKPDPGTDISLPAGSERGYSWSFIRVGYTYGDESKMGEYVIISDVESFNQYVLPNMPEAERSEAAAKYTDAFFSKYFIVRFFLVCSSGSIQPKVTDVALNDGVIEITTESKLEGMGTADMAEHMCIVTLERSIFPADAKIVIDGMKPGSSTVKDK